MAWNDKPNYAPGNLTVNEGYVPAYQASGKPFARTVATSTTAQEIRFPSVTRWVQIANLGATSVNVLIGFSKHGVDGTEEDWFYTLAPVIDGVVSTGRLDLKCKSLWVKSSSVTPSITIIAGLTEVADLNTTLSGSSGVG
jgi:hypothetical protein